MACPGHLSQENGHVEIDVMRDQCRATMLVDSPPQLIAHGVLCYALSPGLLCGDAMDTCAVFGDGIPFGTDDVIASVFFHVIIVKDDPRNGHNPCFRP